MSQEREESGIRFSVADAVALMLVASLLSLANACVRVEPMRFESSGHFQMTLDRSHVIGWPAPIRRWVPGEETSGWLPGGIVTDCLFAVVLAVLVVFTRRTVANWIAVRRRRCSSSDIDGRP